MDSGKGTDHIWSNAIQQERQDLAEKMGESGKIHLEQNIQPINLDTWQPLGPLLKVKLWVWVTYQSKSAQVARA